MVIIYFQAAVWYQRWLAIGFFDLWIHGNKWYIESYLFRPNNQIINTEINFELKSMILADETLISSISYLNCIKIFLTRSQFWSPGIVVACACLYVCEPRACPR